MSLANTRDHLKALMAACKLTLRATRLVVKPSRRTCCCGHVHVSNNPFQTLWQLHHCQLTSCIFPAECSLVARKCTEQAVMPPRLPVEDHVQLGSQAACSRLCLASLHSLHRAAAQQAGSTTGGSVGWGVVVHADCCCNTRTAPQQWPCGIPSAAHAITDAGPEPCT